LWLYERAFERSLFIVVAGDGSWEHHFEQEAVRGVPSQMYAGT
jgi:hypothetical protein